MKVERQDDGRWSVTATDVYLVCEEQVGPFVFATREDAASFVLEAHKRIDEVRVDLDALADGWTGEDGEYWPDVHPPLSPSPSPS